MTKELLYPSTRRDDYKSLIDSSCYYVDKTPILKYLFSQNRSQVLLITRPRRFGKSLTISMISAFLSLNLSDPKNKERHCALFKDQEIFKDTAFCNQFMGQFPVIFISLKSVTALNFTGAYHMLGLLINSLVDSFNFLLDSNKLSSTDKAFLNKLLDLDYIKSESAISEIKISLKKIN